MQRNEDVATDREALRREIRAYVSDILREAGVEDGSPWQWSLDIIRCVVKWERRAKRAFDLIWQTLLVLSLGGAAAWFVTALKLWSGAGWQ